jgi:hypothetical protein
MIDSLEDASPVHILIEPKQSGEAIARPLPHAVIKDMFLPHPL